MYTRRLVLAAVVALAALMLVAQMASAAGMYQGKGPMEGRGPGVMHRGMGPGMMCLDQLRSELNLTPDQVSQIEAIHQNMRTQRQAVMADTTLTREARRARLMELAKSHHAQLMAVLTAEQRDKLQQLHAQRRAERKARWSAELGLTADQQARIQAIKDKQRADIMAVRNDANLTPEAKMARVREIRTAAKQELRSVLTPEQLAKLDAMHKGKMRKPGRAGAGPKVVKPEVVAPQ